MTLEVTDGNHLTCSVSCCKTPWKRQRLTTGFTSPAPVLSFFRTDGKTQLCTNDVSAQPDLFEDGCTLRYWVVVLSRGRRSIFSVNTHHRHLWCVSHSYYRDLDSRHGAGLFRFADAELCFDKTDDGLWGTGGKSRTTPLQGYWRHLNYQRWSIPKQGLAHPCSCAYCQQCPWFSPEFPSELPLIRQTATRSSGSPGPTAAPLPPRTACHPPVTGYMASPPRLERSNDGTRQKVWGGVKDEIHSTIIPNFFSVLFISCLFFCYSRGFGWCFFFYIVGKKEKKGGRNLQRLAMSAGFCSTTTKKKKTV